MGDDIPQSQPWFTALHRATEERPGDTECPQERTALVSLLVSKAYADVNAPDSSGVTPLQSAIKNKNLEAARILLEFCANPNSCGGIPNARINPDAHKTQIGSPKVPTLGCRSRLTAAVISGITTICVFGIVLGSEL